jgi:hypothetical protein
LPVLLKKINLILKYSNKLVDRAKAALKFGNEGWIMKKREEQRLEAAQMTFLRHLLGITKLDKEKNQCLGGKREHRT